MEKQSELLQEGAFCPFFDVGGNKKQNETGYGRDSSFSAGDLAKINLHERTLITQKEWLISQPLRCIIYSKVIGCDSKLDEIRFALSDDQKSSTSTWVVGCYFFLLF